MPIEELIDHPEAMTLPAAAFGMFMRLALHFWQTECRSLPVADHELRGICRAHAPTWRHWKVSILRVFEDVKPCMEAAWRARENRVGNLIRLSQRSSSMRRANAQRLNPHTTTAETSASAGEFLGLMPKRTQANKFKSVQHSHELASSLRDGFIDCGR